MDRKIESRFTKKNKISLAIVTLFLGAIYVHSSNGSSATSGGETANVEKSRLVIAPVVKNDFQEYIPLRAAVESANSVYIDAVEGGRIEKIHVKEGTIVEKGQTILTLSNARLQLDVIAQEAHATEQLNNLHNTQLSLEKNTLDLKEEVIDSDFKITNLSRRLNNIKKLFNSNSVPKDEYDSIVEEIAYWKKRKQLSEERIKHDNLVRTTRETRLKSSINLLEDNLSIARSVLSGLEIKAPQGGKLTSLNAELGESKPQGENLGIIDDVNSFKATAGISEFYINKVNEGQLAEVTIDAKKYQMQVDKVLPEVANSQFQVELSFAGEIPPNLKRGQTLNMNLAVNEAGQAVTVSNGAFFNDTGGAWVFVYDEASDKAVKRLVEFGRKTPSQIEVINGLEPGEKIITSSYKNFLKVDNITVIN